MSVFPTCGNLGGVEIRYGSMEDTKRISQKMVTSDAISYNTLTAGLAAHGHGMEAIELISKMKQEGGYIGMEWAAFLAINKINVTRGFPEENSRARLFTPKSASYYEDYCQSKGVKFITVQFTSTVVD
ncbi:hypothetical protein I3760_03G095100 [Carya illinoinensis]|nr:hypothetical protein I3760_03G095100 [Carya illinoinensis]